MAVNGVWAGDATITKFESSGNHYCANVQVTFYDHFGLDLPDVGPDPTNGHIKDTACYLFFVHGLLSDTALSGDGAYHSSASQRQKSPPEERA